MQNLFVSFVFYLDIFDFFAKIVCTHSTCMLIVFEIGFYRELGLLDVPQKYNCLNFSRCMIFNHFWTDNFDTVPDKALLITKNYCMVRSV